MISLFFISLAAICNAIMDNILFHYYKSIFKNSRFQQWANPDHSWMNKWKNGDITQGEKFLGSSTVFVWITDLWHFSQSLMLIFICLAIINYTPIFSLLENEWDIILDFILLKTTFSVIFEVFWKKILNK